MAVRKIEPVEFEDIVRGTSVTIPVVLKKSDGTPFDLKPFKAYFTLKKFQYDHDYDDDRALISKEIPFDEDLIERGRFNVTLSSKETWLHPGEYIFDIMLVRGHSVGQLCLCKTNIVGTPTNKLVDHEEGESIYYTEPITINPDDKKPPEVHLDTPLVTDPPENLVETLRAVPPYLLQWLDLPDDPRRNALLKVFGPRASLMMTLRVPHDAVEHRYGFEQFFYGKLPIDCPLRGQAIVIKNREVFINTTKPMIMVASDQFIQHSPEITFGANCWDQMNSKPIYIGDNVTSGNLHIQLMEGNDQINIQGTYMMPDDMGGDIVFMLRVDWFNWVDNTPEPFEIEPHPGYHDDDRRKYYGTIGKYEESIWPFNVHYETEGELRGLLGDILRKAKERA